MNHLGLHSFHIPVLGLGFSIDTPQKVARYGISSVVSIMDDGLIEKMREFHCAKFNEEYKPISIQEPDFQARRITAYLNLLQRIVDAQIKDIQSQAFETGSEIQQYFEMLPLGSPVRILFDQMIALEPGLQKTLMQKGLKEKILPGSIDVNIMAKVDGLHYQPDGTALPMEYSHSLSALRGFAKSNLKSSVVLSAGYNPRLYNYFENFEEFYPDAKGKLNKMVILKVSDFRSALVQGQVMARKGIWISEFRIESGLNCGGHAFATEGVLLGPILEEFKQRRTALVQDLFELCSASNSHKGKFPFLQIPAQRITVQGGIGDFQEDTMLREHYGVDGTGWGSPFLLVPEATNVDDHTLGQLAKALQEDYFLSDASPLGVPFNNFRNSTSEQQRKDRIQKQKPGSPCYKKLLSSDTEFTSTPICTASRQYQELKLKQITLRDLTAEQFSSERDKVTAKDCLCEGLGSSALLKNRLPLSHKLKAVTICPGPNLAFFSGIFSLRDMVDHIYGRKNLLNKTFRPHLFINEALLYINYLKREIGRNKDSMNAKQVKYLRAFRDNLLKGIEYYKSFFPVFNLEAQGYLTRFSYQLKGQPFNF